MQKGYNNLELRDHLAAVRSIFASERTLLAYFRTSITMILLGVTFLKLFTEVWINTVGWMLIPTAIGLSVIGLVRHKKRKVTILTEEKNYSNGEVTHKKKITINTNGDF